MSLSQRLLDRMSLRPSRRQIEHSLHSDWIDVDGNRCEVLRLDVHPVNPESHPIREVNIIKFIGAAGRAENLTELTLGGLEDVRGQIWVANPPGYGRSGGSATLQLQIQTARRLYRLVSDQLGCPPFLAGDSLGGAIAICLGAEVDSPGLIVRDPPPIRQLIKKRFGYFRRIAGYFSRLVPDDVDAMSAAPRCKAPAVIVSSRLDQIVPVECQDALIAAYGGKVRKVLARESRHVGLMTGREYAEYRQALDWLLNR